MLYIIPKHDIKDMWSSHNTILRENEVAVITDTHEAVIGDGKTPFNELPRHSLPEQIEHVLIYGPKTNKPCVQVCLGQSVIDKVLEEEETRKNGIKNTNL